MRLITDYRKKLLSLACMLLLFAVSSSFAYPTGVRGAAASAALPAEADTASEETARQADAEARLQENTAGGANAGTGLPEDAAGAANAAEAAGTAEEPGVSYSAADEAADAARKERARFDRDDWQLILVNKQHPIPDDYAFPMGEIGTGMYCDQRIVFQLDRLLTAAQEDGVQLMVASPYRSDNRQEKLFDLRVESYIGEGLSYADAYTKASQTITIPGSSEHQIGLALDFISNAYARLDAGFGETEAGQWLMENGWRYGFILRYPEGKEYLTGIEYEPWHYRYVGREAAEVIHEEALTLEEFWTEYLCFE